ncbi:hypothetical protein [Streptomyces sp. NPDC058394]|uniref:hypothetical protein n=1 Tax=unclassified Streptomyces TaxID=2593676 RepID=UPI00364B1036
MHLNGVIEAAGWWSYAVVFVLTASETSAFIGLLVPGETDFLARRGRQRVPWGDFARGVGTPLIKCCVQLSPETMAAFAGVLVAHTLG